MKETTDEVREKTIEDIRDEGRWERMSGVETKKQTDDSKREVEKNLPDNQ